jgi:isopenicillin N synthase-like dioxygenase
MNRFFTEASSVAERTLRLVYRALAGDGISQLATPEGDPRTSTVRLNYYPVADPLSGDEQLAVAGLGDMALHHHTDPGVLTLLLQDMTGGLQTLSKEDGWIDVTPEESTIVVNLGDSLQVWSNDNYRAAIHRVVPMTTLKNGSDGRFSTPYFYNPKGDAMLEPLSALSADTPLYRPFTWREYIKGRVDDNYTDLGEEDIQIAQYRV